MGVKARTPVMWPRMKVRGRRRRALVAQRVRTGFVIPFARPMKVEGGVTFVPLTGWEPGAVRIQSVTVRDGFGRVVKEGAR